MDKLTKIKEFILKDRRILASVISFVLLFAIFLTQLFVRYNMKSKVEISEVFLGSNVMNSKSSLEIAGEYKTKTLTEKEKEKILRTVADEIGLEFSKEEIKETVIGHATQVLIDKKSDVASTKLQLVSVNINEEGEIPVVNNYVMVHLEMYDHIDSIMSYKLMIEDAFDKLDISNDDSYVQFTGSYLGKLTLEHRNEIADQMIRKLKARVTYENRVEDFYTIYAYTGGVKDYINVGDSKVNIQVAMNYNEVQDKTVVYLATPILNGSY